MILIIESDNIRPEWVEEIKESAMVHYDEESREITKDRECRCEVDDGGFRLLHRVLHSLHNVKCGGTAAQDSQSEANEGASPPLPRTT